MFNLFSPNPCSSHIALRCFWLSVSLRSLNVPLRVRLRSRALRNFQNPSQTACGLRLSSAQFNIALRCGCRLLRRFPFTERFLGSEVKLCFASFALKLLTAFRVLSGAFSCSLSVSFSRFALYSEPTYDTKGQVPCQQQNSLFCMKFLRLVSAPRTGKAGI